MTRTLTGHRASCVALAFHRDGQFLISGSQDTNAKVRPCCTWVQWEWLAGWRMCACMCKSLTALAHNRHH